MVTSANSRRPEISRKNVLLYDGQCGLCHAVVRFLLRHDRREALLFAPLQGPTSQLFLRHHGMNTNVFSSLVLVADLDATDTRYWLRTDAILQIFRSLGGAWKFWLIFGFLPRSWRDALYEIVARTRHRFFGEYRPTPLEKKEWLTRFIDPPS